MVTITESRAVLPTRAGKHIVPRQRTVSRPLPCNLGARLARPDAAVRETGQHWTDSRGFKGLRAGHPEPGNTQFCREGRTGFPARSSLPHSLWRPSEVQDLGGTAASPAHWDHCDWHPPSPHVAVQQPVSPARLPAPEGKRVSHCRRRLEPQCLVQISGLPLTIGVSWGPLTDLSVSLFPHPSREIILEPTHGITN